MVKRGLFLALFLVLALLPLVCATECPRGLVNDSYPGQCGLYSDNNKNGICDYSELNESPAENLAAESSFSLLRTTYNTIPIVLVLLILYVLSAFLVKSKKISVVTHRKFWNLLLLASFLFCAVTSVVFLMKLDFGMNTSWWPGSLIFGHIESGIVLITIAIFHALWHIPYFKSYFARNQ